MLTIVLIFNFKSVSGVNMRNNKNLYKMILDIIMTIIIIVLYKFIDNTNI